MKYKLKNALKTYTYDTHRTINPKETIKKVSEKTHLAGILKVECVTSSDRLNLPIYICERARSNSRFNHTGKGFTEDQAKASALMEAFERFSAEPTIKKIKQLIFKSFDKMSNVLNPYELMLPSNTSYTPEMKLRWIECRSLPADQLTYLPACAIYYPYNLLDEMQILKPNTNGLASGNSYEEAVLHGLMEVIERDAWSLVELRKKIKHDITVEDSENTIIGNILKIFNKAKVNVTLKDITSDIGIPTIAAVSEDILLNDPALMVIGFGSHLSPEIAAVRALLEAAQNRMIQLHGLRKDTILKADIARRMGYERIKRINKHWFTTSVKSIEIKNMPFLDTDDLLEDIYVTLKQLSMTGFRKIFIANLTNSKIKIPAVRVIVPGLESSVIEPERLGRAHY